LDRPGVERQRGGAAESRIDRLLYEQGGRKVGVAQRQSN